MPKDYAEIRRGDYADRFLWCVWDRVQSFPFWLGWPIGVASVVLLFVPATFILLYEIFLETKDHWK